MKTELTELTGMFEGMIGGTRIYREKRGVWQVQDLKQPHLASMTGTLREIERKLHQNLTRIW